MVEKVLTTKKNFTVTERELLIIAETLKKTIFFGKILIIILIIKTLNVRTLILIEYLDEYLYFNSMVKM